MLQKKGHTKIKFIKKYEKDTPPFVDDQGAIVSSREFFEHKGATQDNFAFALCHEIGHILGGSPTWKHFNGLSVEGQADYWGAKECFPLYLKAKKSLRSVGPEISNLCETKYADAGQSKICAQTIAAGMDLIEYFRIYTHEDPINLSDIILGKTKFTPVNSTLKLHPPTECRFQTYINAALGEERPSCWYNPEKLPDPK